MGTEFYHGFKTGLGPFVLRDTSREIPESLDCANVRNGKVVLNIKKNPLRTAHLWVPAEEFTVTEGFVEFRMKFRGGPGAHGSGWLQGLSPHLDPRLNHEVDVVENFGSPKVAHHGIWTEDDEDITLDQVVHGSWRGDMTEWNVFGCEMSKTGYTFTVNDVAVTATTAYVSDNPKYLILSMLISSWEIIRFGEGNPYDQQAHCDWVRVSSL